MKKLNFGCGLKILDGFVNVDIQKAKGVINFNFDKSPYPFKDNTFEFILADNVFEHLLDPKKSLEELHRISKKGAHIKIIVPHYRAKGAYNDITHKHWFNETALTQLALGNFYNHKNKLSFKIISLNLIPTKFGKLFVFKKLQSIASLLFGEVYGSIELELEVLK